MSIYRFLYSIALYCLTPLIILRLLMRSRKNPAYRQRMAERFGFFPALTNTPRICLHAVSVGETIAAKPLITGLLAAYPDHQLLVTTTTPTGSDTVKRLFADRVEHVYLPYDTSGSIKRFLAKTRPEKLIIMETEIWPNLYAACQKRDIPIVIANARLSERSTKSYLKIRPLIAETLQGVCFIAARDQNDVNNFAALGADPQKLKAVGNIKYDLNVPEQQVALGQTFKQQWGKQRLVCLAASTHQGEDEQILSIYSRLKTPFPELLLILVPRHPERFDQVAELIEKQSLIYQRRSQANEFFSNTDVILGDSLGEMFVWFAASDIVFMGGSLVETGGHNPLEPAALGKPVVSGQFVFNFSEIFSQLTEQQATWVENSTENITTRLELLLNDAQLRNAAGEQAKALLNVHKGASKRIMGYISGCKHS